MADRAAFARLNADPEVMRHFPSPLDRAASDALIERCQAGILAQGWGLWALERREDRVLLGLLGLTPVGAELPFAPAVEIGWRLARPFWGQGYAQEGACAALDFGFAILGLAEIVAYTAQANQRSATLMQRLGMQEAEPFDHPRMPPGHPLRTLRLFRLPRQDWLPSGKAKRRVSAQSSN